MNARRRSVATCPSGHGCSISDRGRLSPACIPCIFALMDREVERVAFYNSETGTYIQRCRKRKQSMVPIMFLGQQSEEIQRLRKLFRIAISCILEASETTPNSSDGYIS